MTGWLCVLAMVAAISCVLFITRKDEEHRHQEVATAVGGESAWPAQDWEIHHGNLLHPHRPSGALGDPVSGSAAGRRYTSYQVSHSEWKARPTVTLGVKYTTTTWPYTGVAILDVDRSITHTEIMRPGPTWESEFQGESLGPLQFTTGDAEIDQYFATYATDPDQARTLLTVPTVKRLVFQVHNLDPEQLPSPRIRIVDGKLWCWVPDHTARHKASFQQLLHLLAALADAIDSARDVPPKGQQGPSKPSWL